MPPKPVSFRTFSPEERAFLNATHDDPLDFVPRRVFGDWLTERDDPLGEFIHLQVLKATCGGEPPRGTKARILKLERQHGLFWRGAPSNRQRRFVYGGFFDFFIWGLPDIVLFVGSGSEPARTLDAAFAQRPPSHQIKVIFDIEPRAPDDLRPLFRHEAFGIVHSVEVRKWIGQQSNGIPRHGHIGARHLQQAMECFDRRPFRCLFFRGVSPDISKAAEQFKASAKARVHCSG